MDNAIAGTIGISLIVMLGFITIRLAEIRNALYEIRDSLKSTSGAVSKYTERR